MLFMIEPEMYFDKEIRKDINELINLLYLECKNEAGGLEKDTFLFLANLFKEKASEHFQQVTDAYNKL